MTTHGRRCRPEAGLGVPRAGGRVAQAFDLAGITNTVGAPFLRVFCEGRESKMPGRQVSLIACPQQNQIAHAASPPTLANKRKDGAPSVGMHAKVVKGGPPTSERSPLESFGGWVASVLGVALLRLDAEPVLHEQFESRDLIIVQFTAVSDGVPDLVELVN